MYLFQSSEGTMINCINTSIDFLCMWLGPLSIWPNIKTIWEHMPETMHENAYCSKCSNSSDLFISN